MADPEKHQRICRHQPLYSILRVLAAYVKQLPCLSLIKIEEEGAGEMIQIECVLYVVWESAFNLQNPCKEKSMVVCAYNPSTREVDKHRLTPGANVISKPQVPGKNPASKPTARCLATENQHLRLTLGSTWTHTHMCMYIHTNDLCSDSLSTAFCRTPLFHKLPLKSLHLW